jgi:pimeloyl-ACP methyl ester carboxylesterase
MESPGLIAPAPTGVAMTGVRRSTVDVDVRAVAPAGCNRIAADIFVPQDMGPRPLLWVCIPGGGINRQYFDLQVAGQEGAFSMARHLAAGGNLVVTVDPPGVGGSDAPDDGYTLTPPVVAEVLASAIESLQEDLGRDGIAGAELGRVTPRATIGLGHSAGALLVAFQQAHHRSYDVLALLGFSASGLPGVLNEEELSYAGRPREFAEVVKSLTKARFGDPLPQWSNSSAGELEPNTVSTQVDVALAAASSRLLALVGMSAIVPGSVQPELDALRVPIFAALGEHDLAGTLDVLPSQLPACGDLTLFLLEGAGHNHNVAVNRRILWDRVARWSASVTP